MNFFWQKGWVFLLLQLFGEISIVSGMESFSIEAQRRALKQNLMSKYMQSKRDFIIEGHRGAQSLYPENTLDSFRAALELGVDFVELDLLATSDGEIAIHHDYEVGGKLIHSLTRLELKKIDCGSTVNSDFPMQKPSPNAQIPLLSELFEMVQKSSHPNAKQIRFNLEIKSDPLHPEYTLPLHIMAKKILEIVKIYQFETRVYYSSFNPEALFYIRKEDPTAVIALLYSSGAGVDWLPKILEICAKLKASIFSPQESLLTPEIVSTCRDAKLWVIPWTINDVRRGSELMGWGVNGIITDYPQRFL